MTCFTRHNLNMVVGALVVLAAMGLASRVKADEFRQSDYCAKLAREIASLLEVNNNWQQIKAANLVAIYQKSCPPDTLNREVDKILK